MMEKYGIMQGDDETVDCPRCGRPALAAGQLVLCEPCGGARSPKTPAAKKDTPNKEKDPAHGSKAPQEAVE